MKAARNRHPGEPIAPEQKTRRGYHRPRPQPATDPVMFELEGHRFESSWRDLWVTRPQEQRVNRIKITRGRVSRSAHRGYPAELFSADTDLTLDDARAMADFWLRWKDTPEKSPHGDITLDHHRRRLELSAGSKEAA